MNKSYLLPLFLIATLLFSCQKEGFERYSVDSTLDPYLQMFLEEGRKRGVDIDVEKNGLIMEFAKLQRPTIGLCTYQKPLLVQIDRDYWKEVMQYENQEELRQNVVFHELAHGLLNRPHINTYLPNLEWKSIMCGGDEVAGRDWSVNFNGYRKEYYLDELFNIHTEAPAWSMNEAFNGEKGNLIGETILNYEYQNIDTEGNIHTISGDSYTITTTKTENHIAIPLGIPADQFTGDFYFETIMKVNFKMENSCAGIAAIYDYDNDHNYNWHARTMDDSISDGTNYIAINPTNVGDQIFLVNSNCQLPIAEILDKEVFQKDDFNKYAIARHNGELFFYINDQLIFRNDFRADKTYLAFGIVIPAKGTTKIKSCQLYETSTGLKSGKLERHNTPIIKGPLRVDLDPSKKLNLYRQ